MTISIRVSEIDAALIREYADHENVTVSELIRKVVIEWIEQDYRKLAGTLEKESETEEHN